MLRVSFRIIRSLKMNIFVNFDLDLPFQGHLLQELSANAQCNYFCKILMEIS